MQAVSKWCYGQIHRLVLGLTRLINAKNRKFDSFLTVFAYKHPKISLCIWPKCQPNTSHTHGCLLAWSEWNTQRDSCLEKTQHHQKLSFLLFFGGVGYFSGMNPSVYFTLTMLGGAHGCGVNWYSSGFKYTGWSWGACMQKLSKIQFFNFFSIWQQAH